MAEASVQPVPWVFLVATRGATKRTQLPAWTSKIDTFPAGGAIVVKMAALDQHGANAEFQQNLGLSPHFFLVTRLRHIEQRRCLGQIGRDHVRARNQFAQMPHRVHVQQSRAGGSDHDRIEHDMARPIAIERRGDGIDRAGITEHANLYRADFEVAKDRIDLGGDEVCRHVMDAKHALGVLCGERRDDCRPIDA